MIKYILILMQSVILFSLSTSEIETHKQKCQDTENYTSCLLLNNHYMTRYNQKSVEYFTQSCEQGLISSCNSLARLYEKGGNGIAKNLPQAIMYYTKVCNSGNATVCGIVGEFYKNGNAVKQNMQKASEFYTKACLGGSNASCSSLAFMYVAGKGVEKDIAYAADLLKDACDNGYEYACDHYNQLRKSNKI